MLLNFSLPIGRKSLWKELVLYKTANNFTIFQFKLNSYTEYVVIFCNSYVEVQNTSLTGIDQMVHASPYSRKVFMYKK